MPSFSRLAGCLLLAALGWYVSELIKPLFPNDRDVGWFSEVNAAFCALVGWKFLGARARGSIRDAIGNGLTAAVMMLVLALFFQCLAEMLRNSWDKRYDNAPEAVIAIFDLMVEYGLMLSTVEVWGTLLIGGIVAGFITEAVAHRMD